MYLDILNWKEYGSVFLVVLSSALGIWKGRELERNQISFIKIMSQKQLY